MALTSGEKQKQATVSSIQSRMGVVDTYSGENPIGLAAKNASAVLDVFAEREAKKEELSWKTDFKLKSRNHLLELARKHYDDPDAFTKEADTYRNTLITAAPTRFKEYAKEYTGNIAFEYGDNIWKEAKAQKEILEFSNWQKQHSNFLADMNEGIMNKNSFEMQDYFTQSLKPQMADEISDYETFYDSVDSSIQALLADKFGTPDVFAKTVMIQAETTRLISIANKELIQAQVDDSNMIQANGEYPEDYITEVSKVNDKHAKWGENYLDNPTHDEEDASVLKDTDRNDRMVILEQVQKFTTDWNQKNEKNVLKQNTILEVGKQEEVKNIIASIKNGSTWDSSELRAYGISQGFNESQLTNLQNENLLQLQIDSVSKSIGTYKVSKETGNYDFIINKDFTQGDIIKTLQTNTKWLQDKGVEITLEEFTDRVMMSNMYSVFSILNPEATYQDFLSMDLDTVITNQPISNNNFLTNALVKITDKYGSAPSMLLEYFDTYDTFNFELADDRLRLRNMAAFANNLYLNNGRFPIPLGDDEKANKAFEALVDLHQEFLRVDKTNPDRLNLNEREINDTIDIADYEKFIVEQWTAKYLPNQTKLDERITDIRNFINDNDIDLTGMMADYFKDREEDGPWYGLFFTDQGLLTGNPEINLVGDDADLIPEFNLVMELAGDEIYTRLASSIDSTRGLSEQVIRNQINKQLPYLLMTLRSQGWGYDENTGWSMQ